MCTVLEDIEYWHGGGREAVNEESFKLAFGEV